VPARLALDQNFPEPILTVFGQYLPEVDLVPLRRIDPRLPTLGDRQLVLALHQLGWAGLVTNNYKMLEVPSELAAILKTKLAIFAVQGVGDDPVRAAGAVLLDLPGCLKDFVPGKGAIYWLRPRRPRPREPWDLFGEAASRRRRKRSDLYAEVVVSDAELATPVLD
jgi:hypothetical protein